MSNRLLAAAVLVTLLWPSSARAADPLTVVDGLAFPAGIAFDSAGTMYVTEREGRILAFARGAKGRLVASIPTITQGETGLLGIAVSLDDRFVYAFATEHDQTNTIWRVASTGGEPERVVEGLPGGSYHNGGGVAFGPDGMLYVSNGERHDSGVAQDPAALGGKVYRYTPDGGIPTDNPFGDSPAFSIGLRNPFGLAIDPVSGHPFVTENGPESYDEINRIVAGGNYGWPQISGPARGAPTKGFEGTYQDPVIAYETIVVPTGIAFADPEESLPGVAGDLFFGTYGDQMIHRVELNRARDRVVRDVEWFDAREPVVALAWGPRGLYYSTPTAIKLFALARSERSSTPAGDPAAPPGRPQGPSAVDDDRASSTTEVAVILIGAAVLVLVAALVFAFGKRRGRT
jgi:glucose/arabinose dehydrogenase